MTKEKIIIDCDPGHDDAIAIMIANKASNLELIGITSESGNQTIDKTTKNILNICEYLNIDVPVAKGATRPLIRDAIICDAIHGETGLDGFPFLKLHKKALEMNAVSFLRKTLLENDKVTIVTTGAMTNIALLLRSDEEVKKHIEKIVVMGGSMGEGNVSPAAEFNILCDPEAAHIVFSSDLPIYMVGLDVTRKALVINKYIEQIKKCNNIASTLFCDLMEVFNKNQREVFHLEAGPLHDPMTIAYLINPDVLHFELMNVEIDLSHGSSYGRTNCDVSNYLGHKKNVFVATNVDIKLFFDIIEEMISKY